jgi:hypothetical protein
MVSKIFQDISYLSEAFKSQHQTSYAPNVAFQQFLPQIFAETAAENSLLFFG